MTRQRGQRRRKPAASSAANPARQALLEQLADCRIRDRFRLRRRILDAADDDALQDIERAIARSAAQVESRRRPLAIHYPQALPVSGRAEEIRRVIDTNQVVILAGETGSGKTTQLPKLCLELGRGAAGMIGHTQPRRVAARTVAARLAEELAVPLGREVGYQVRFTDEVSEHTRIKVMTDGILLASIQKDRFLEQYDTLIIDEAHERSLNIDFLLGYVRRILPKRRDLKVVVTSATIDVERFAAHFDAAPIIEVSGRTHPVTVHYRPLAESADGDPLLRGLLDAVQEIIESPAMQRPARRARDILVFLPGERDIRDASLALRKLKLQDTEILPLYARLSVSEQNRVFQPHAGRRIVLATNVAETSLTVPGIGYVIDSGLARISRYSTRSRVQRLPIEAVSRASAEQRKGRCGRIGEGICLRLFDEADFEARPDFTDPEIARTGLASVILQMLQLRLGDIREFPFIEPPDSRQINDGFQHLQELGAVDQRRALTPLGRRMARLPVDVHLARMLLAAAERGCLSEVLVIVSGLAVQDPRERPGDKREAADTRHRQDWHDDSDFMAWLNLWRRFEAQRQALGASQLRRWCRDEFLNLQRLREWRDLHRQLHLACRDLGLAVNGEAAGYAAIHQSLLSGFLGQIGEKQDKGEYLGARNRRFHLFPGSSQSGGSPRWVMAAELTETSRLYARGVARIDPRWIEPLAQHLVTRVYDDPHFEKRRGQVVALETVSLYGLPVVRRRPVNFGPLDPARSREVFIQGALVDGELEGFAFVAHNQALIDGLEQIESKTRRRDLLVEDTMKHAFFAARLPEHVCDVASLRGWLGRDAGHEATLQMTRETLLKRDIDLPDSEFPDRLQTGGSRLELDYEFDPGRARDGVTVRIPLAALAQVQENQIDYLVPGLLREKCIALVKTLPGRLRRHFVPVPDTVDHIFDGIAFDGRSLRENLAERLRIFSNQPLCADDFDLSRLDAHLSMRIALLDDDGKEIDSGRDLGALQARHGGVRSDLVSRHKLARDGITRWDFGSLPQRVEQTVAGANVVSFPALVDHRDSVAIELFQDIHAANAQHRLGLLRLLQFALPQQVQYIGRNLPGFEDLALRYITIGDAQSLRRDLVHRVFRETFADPIESVDDQSVSLVRDEAAFRQCQEARSRLATMANEVCRVTAPVLQLNQNVRCALQDITASALLPAARDIASHLDRLVYPGFLRDTPLRWLTQYPRYLKAVMQRIDKLPQRPAQDTELMETCHPFEARIQDMEPLVAEQDAALLHYRFMLEEFRVSLFAQALGTRLSVSAKRLERQWSLVRLQTVPGSRGEPGNPARRAT